MHYPQARQVKQQRFSMYPSSQSALFPMLFRGRADTTFPESERLKRWRADHKPRIFYLPLALLF